MKLIKKLAAVAVALTITAAPAVAATDGLLGSTSTGSLDITVNIGDLVRITNFQDIAFGTYSGSGDLNADDDLCVYRNNTASANYTITATATEGSFQVESGANNIDYDVFFNDVTGTTGEIALAYNTVSVAQSGANTASETCATGGLTSNVHVRMVEADLQAAAPGAYSGTLILTAAPV